MNWQAKLGVAVCAAIALLAFDPVLAGSAARTRPSGGSSGAAHGGHSSGGSAHGHASYGSAPTRASGRATYGYGYGHGYHGGGYYGAPCYGGYPWYGYYGWYGAGYPYWWWGGYYGAWGVWAYPGVYTTEGYPAWTTASDELPAVIVTDVEPGKATLRLDGEDVGRAKEYRGTWNRLPVKPGIHTLELEAEGYKTLRVAIDAKAGRSYEIREVLQKGEGEDPRSLAEAPAPTPPTSVAGGEPSPSGLKIGRLRLAVTPEDAAVYLDGEFLGSGRELAQLHGALPIAVGDHVVDLVRPGYRRKSIAVAIPEGEPVPLRLALTDEDRE